MSIGLHRQHTHLRAVAMGDDETVTRAHDLGQIFSRKCYITLLCCGRHLLTTAKQGIPTQGCDN
jgi:hypothetical protein